MLRKSPKNYGMILSATILCSISESSATSRAQTVEDGSDAALGSKDTKTVLALIKGNLERGADAKVSALRRSTGSFVCGTVNVKGNQDLYLGERGFVVDLAALTLDRVPEGVELLNPRAEGFAEKERIRVLYFDKCLD